MSDLSHCGRRIGCASSLQVSLCSFLLWFITSGLSESSEFLSDEDNFEKTLESVFVWIESIDECFIVTNTDPTSKPASVFHPYFPFTL